MHKAEEGLLRLDQSVDHLIAVPNDKSLEMSDRNVITLHEAFRFAHNVIKGVIVGIAESLTAPGQATIDFQDVRALRSVIDKAMTD